MKLPYVENCDASLLVNLSLSILRWISTSLQKDRLSPVFFAYRSVSPLSRKVLRFFGSVANDLLFGSIPDNLLFGIFSILSTTPAKDNLFSSCLFAFLPDGDSVPFRLCAPS